MVFFSVDKFSDKGPKSNASLRGKRFFRAGQSQGVSDELDKVGHVESFSKLRERRNRSCSAQRPKVGGQKNCALRVFVSWGEKQTTFSETQ